MNGVTLRRQAILDFIQGYVATHGYAPSVREIGAAVGLSSVSSVHAQLDALERAGRIARRRGSPRALRVIDTAVRV